MKALPILFLTLSLGAPALTGASSYRLGDMPEKNDGGKTSEAEKKAAEEREILSNEVAEEFYQRGLEALDSDMLDQAEGYFDRALILDPHHEGAQLGLQKVILRHEEEVEKAKQTPESPKMDTKLALRKNLEEDLNAKLEDNRLQAARRTARKILAIYPDHQRAKEAVEETEKKLFRIEVQRAADLEKKDQFEAAISSLEKARRYRDDPYLDSKIASIKRRMGKKLNRRAEELYLAALQASQLGQSDKALELCRKALEIQPDHTQALRMLRRLGGEPAP